MSRLSVYSEAPTGGDRVYLDSLGPIRGLRLSTTINGDQGATWQAALDVRMTHRALQPGRRIIVPISPAQAWQGVLNTPQRGTVWQFSATGTAAMLDRWSAIDATTAANALSLNEIVDEAITRGLAATRGTLPTLPAGTQPSGSVTVAAALSQVTSGLNQWWNISRAGKITAAALPTTVSYLLKAQDNAGGRTVEGFVTDVTVVYQNVNYKLAVLQRSNATARAKYGRFEQFLDLTGEGPLTTAQAQTRGDNYLTANAPRLKFAGSWTVARGQLLNSGGTPVDLATVVSGGLTRVMLTDPDTSAGEFTLDPVQVVIGQTDYDVDSDQMALTPLDYSPQGLSTLVGGSQASGGSQATVAYQPPQNIQRGEQSVTLTAVDHNFASVVFDAPFTAAPGVFLTQRSLPAGSGRLVPKVLNITTTGFDLYMYTGDGSTTTTTATVSWLAVG